MIPIDINFTTYIPTTLLGFLGLISGYLFFYFKNKSDNKLKQIQSTVPKDRVKVIEMSLNELGISIDTSNLKSAEKLLLIKGLMRAKTNRYLIISITAIMLASLITVLLWNSENKVSKQSNNSLDTTKSIRLPTIVKDTVSTKINHTPEITKKVSSSPKVSLLGTTDFLEIKKHFTELDYRITQMEAFINDVDTCTQNDKWVHSLFLWRVLVGDNAYKSTISDFNHISTIDILTWFQLYIDVNFKSYDNAFAALELLDTQRDNAGNYDVKKVKESLRILKKFTSEVKIYIHHNSKIYSQKEVLNDGVLK